jgi:hypothetical protein
MFAPGSASRLSSGVTSFILDEVMLGVPCGSSKEGLLVGGGIFKAVSPDAMLALGSIVVLSSNIKVGSSQHQTHQGQKKRSRPCSWFAI